MKDNENSLTTHRRKVKLFSCGHFIKSFDPQTHISSLEFFHVTTPQGVAKCPRAQRGRCKARTERDGQLTTKERKNLLPGGKVCDRKRDKLTAERRRTSAFLDQRGDKFHINGQSRLPRSHTHTGDT